MNMWASKQKGFTIVELLIVVVVIAILAAITIVAYNGIRDRTEQSAQASSLSQASKKLRTYAIENNGSYPATIASVGFENHQGTTYNYQVDNTVNPQYFCASVKVGNAPTQFISSKNDQPAPGSCQDLVGWWPFNGDTADFSRYSHTVSGSGFSPTTGQGTSSGAYEFNGQNMTVSGFDHDVLRSTPTGIASSWTLSAWAKAANATQTNESIILGRPGCHGGLYTYNNNYQFAIKSAVSGNCWSGAAAIDGAPIDTNWHFLTGVYEAGAMRMYVDGKLANTTNLSETMYGYSTTLSIGGYPGRMFTGKVDDARVYSRALTASEIADMYSLGAY